MRSVELIAMLSGAVFATTMPVAALTCSSSPRRWLRFALPLVALANLLVVALSFVERVAPPVEGLATIALTVAMVAVGIHLSAPRLREPVWWASFEEAFWAHVG